MTEPVSQQRRVVHLRAFFAYVLRQFPLARVALLMTSALLVLEYATLSLMIPLAAAAGGAATGNARVVALWTDLARALGLPINLLTWLWLFLVMLALRTSLGYAHLVVTTHLAKQVHRRLSENVFSRVLFDEPITQIYKRTMGFYISLAGDDTYRAGSMVNSALLFLAGAGSAACGLVLLFLFSRVAFFATVAFLTLAAVVIVVCIRHMLRLNSRSVALSREAGTGFLEALNSLRSIRSMGSEEFARENYALQMRDYTSLLARVDALKNGIRFVPGIIALLTGIVMLGPWWSGSITVSGGAIFGATTILIRVFTSLGALMTAGGTFVIDARAAKDLGELTSFHHSAARSTAAITDSAPAAIQRLDLGGICYAYPDGPRVLNNLTATFQQGRCYAVVGPSGSGKSTLADVLLGLVEPTAGTLRIDGRESATERLRRRVVLVEQQPRIFSVSLRENLTLGLERADEEVMAALAAVDMDAFTRSLSRGLDTLLEYQGANLSGGQRQRLSIARALLRRPDMLILDEATSALDAATRDAVVAGIKAFMRDGILVFITHDDTVAAIAEEVLDLRADASLSKFRVNER